MSSPGERYSLEEYESEIYPPVSILLSFITEVTLVRELPIAGWMENDYEPHEVLMSALHGCFERRDVIIKHMSVEEKMRWIEHEKTQARGLLKQIDPRKIDPISLAALNFVAENGLEITQGSPFRNN